MDKQSVMDRLDFAKRRLIDLKELARNGEDLAGAAPKERQQLIQEFFFHLVGAIDFLAQVVNTSKTLGIDVEKVTVVEVCRKLNKNNPIKSILEELHPKTRGEPIPDDPYSREGCHFRILRYRNRVCHQGHNPFYFSLGPGKPPTSLFLDPINGSHGGSEKSAISELKQFYDLVYDKCLKVLEEL